MHKHIYIKGVFHNNNMFFSIQSSDLDDDAYREAPGQVARLFDSTLTIVCISVMGYRHELLLLTFFFIL